MFRCVALAACLLTSAAQAAPSILAPPTAPGAATLRYVKTKAPVIVLRHVRLIDGNLCSVTYPEAAALGIDNLEHGFFVNTQNDPGKALDTCPPSVGLPTLLGMDPAGSEAAKLIKLLVDRKVAITSTLPMIEQFVIGHAPLDARAMAVLTPQAREAYLYSRNQLNGAPREFLAKITKAFQATMALERRFALAGGLLLAGPDPTGNGGVIPGFGDQRAIELLVEAGFSPVEAIRVGTLNG